MNDLMAYLLMRQRLSSLFPSSSYMKTRRKTRTKMTSRTKILQRVKNRAWRVTSWTASRCPTIQPPGAGQTMISGRDSSST